MIIKNGIVYDPINKIDGERMDIFIKNGKIVDEAGGEVVDASGLNVMPGGVEIHTHIAGSKVNLGRLLRPEDHRKDVVARADITRSGVGYTVPSTFVTGYRYAKLGYTMAMEAAIPPLSARHTHEELNDTPIVDNGGFVLMGDNYIALKFIERKDLDGLKNFVAWLLWATKGYAIKLVNPGGVESWKWGKVIENLDDTMEGFSVTPREIITAFVRVNEKLGLPHPVHLHCNNLGSPGNVRTTLESMTAVKDRLHITHVQFNGYAGEDWPSLRSGAPEIADCVNKHDHVTCDMGQVIFGDATTMTADGPWQYRLSKLTGNKWYNSDVELEAGAGIVPYVFKKRSLANSIQWAIGLEAALLIKDPWKIYLTTDHPNAGLFYHYPKVIAWLMSKKKREEQLAEIHRTATSRASIAGIDREYSLYEIAIITRAGTAKALGLKKKGHLGVGADADVAIYEFSEDDPEGSFSTAKYVLKDGEIVVKDGNVVKNYLGRRFWVNAGGEVTDEIREFFSKYYTVSLENYPVQDEYLSKQEVISCG